MSYDVQLYRKEVKERQLTSNSEDFFEQEGCLVDFTDEQKESLKNRLLQYGYYLENESGGDLSFGFKTDKAIAALLTRNGLFFSSSGEGVFEISMTASEFTDTGEFVKYDPQANGWEEI